VILVDTSVWIDHFRQGDATLAQALHQGAVMMHPFVLGEIACGALKRRQETLQLLANLPASPVATDAEALRFIERHRLMSLGIGFIDVHLLTSIALAGDGRLWSRDKRLSAVAKRLRLDFHRPGH